ncbi:ABC transporter permease subunit [Bacillus sp. FJAT-27916]|uniref:ABC transporter permease subunit n=1 Tax=Bacillus sp. FJAT-27916 TaxID=1679169 RepID=UPI00067119CC|nr:ABC transporter permease subunit [Bacillus sp. FJAT-27916]
MAKQLLHSFAGIGLMVMGVILISGLPALFRDIGFHFTDYVESIKLVFMALLSPQDMDYGGTGRMVFPEILGPYRTTLSLMAVSLLGSLFISFLLTYITLFLGRRHLSKIEWVLSLLQALPDLFYIAFSQWMIVLIYKGTGILIMDVARYGTWQSMMLPLVCLSLPLTLLLTRFLLQQFLVEKKKMYAEYASSKGFTELYIFNHHILRNVLFSLINYSKTVLWFMISNLIIIEYLFSINGIIGFIYRYLTPEFFAIGTILLAVPVLIVYDMAQLLVPEKRRDEGV